MSRRRPDPKPEQYEEAAHIIHAINEGGMDTTLFLASILAERDRQIRELSDKEELERITRVSLETRSDYAMMLDQLVSALAVLNKCKVYIERSIKFPALCGCEPGGGAADLEPGFLCDAHAILNTIDKPSEYDTVAKRRIQALELRSGFQKQEISKLQENNHTKNLRLDAMAWVWCDGTCKGGVFRHDHSRELTEELVLIAERNVARLRHKLHNLKIVDYPWYKRVQFAWRWLRAEHRLWRFGL